MLWNDYEIREQELVTPHLSRLRQQDAGKRQIYMWNPSASWTKNCSHVMEAKFNSPLEKKFLYTHGIERSHISLQVVGGTRGKGEPSLGISLLILFDSPLSF